MKRLTNALRMSGVLLVLAMVSAMLLPGTADAQGVVLVSVEGATTDENDTFVDARVRLSSAVNSVTTVQFATSSDTAKAGSDFYGTFQTITFQPGERIKVARVDIVNDNVFEGNEQFNVRIFGVESAANVVTGATHAKVTIRDDDRGTPNAIVNVSGTTINEGADFVDVRIRRSGPGVELAATVEFATFANTARPGQDFYGKAETVRFLPNETVKVVRIDMLDDLVREPTENFGVRIWGGVNVEVRTSRAFVQINDND